MSTEELCYTPATELASRIRRGALSPVTVVDAFLDRIEDRNDDINAYVTVIEDEARDAAREAERAVDHGDHLGPLHGVPIALKDLHAYKKGVRNTYGSIPFKDYVPDHDASFVKRLEDAGAIVLGKTNTPEFGPKGTTDNLLFGPTSTPFDLDRNSGGSSGGSAAAVADGLCAIAQGSDGGGSLRIPASFSGIYTIKPTYRRVASVERPNAFGSHTSFSHRGPLARSVEDAALMLDVMAGPESRDPFALPDDGTEYLRATRRSIDGAKIAYTPDYGIFPIDDRVLDIVDDAVWAFEDAGAEVDEIDIEMDHSHRTLTDVWLKFSMVGHATRAATLKDEEGMDLLGDHRDEITNELIRMIEGGQDISAIEYTRANHIRTDVLDTIEDVLDEYDFIASPTLACPPVKNTDDGHTVGPTEINGEPVDPQIGWCITYLINFTGHPAASVPAGVTNDGLPIGMQIVGRRHADDAVLAASAAFERVKPWFDSYPPR